MEHIIGVTELQRRFRSVLDEVTKKRFSVVLTKGSRPEAVLIPYDEYLRMRSVEQEKIMSHLDEVLSRLAALNKEFSDEEVDADLSLVDHQRSKVKKNARRR